MTDKTLKNARGLNSIADPSSFKGTSGRARVGTKQTPTDPPADVEKKPQVNVPRSVVVEAVGEWQAEPVAQESSKLEVRERRLTDSSKRRVRRELTVPERVFELIEAAQINPADILNQAYLHHRGAVRSGELGRSVAKGRKRLRVSMTNGEFERITKLADFRGWNRSETVAVLVTAELGENKFTH